MRLEWLAQALHDFDEIIDYIAKDSPVAAMEQGDKIERQVAGLLDNHLLGRPGRVKGTRELVIARTSYIGCLSSQKGVDPDSPGSSRRTSLARRVLTAAHLQVSTQPYKIAFSHRL